MSIKSVFISYSHHDKDWVRDWLLPRLEGVGLQVCIDFRDFDVGVPSLVNMERAVERSRKTLLVLTPNWVKSEWTSFEAMLVQTDDPIGIRRRILPFMLKRCQPPSRIAMLTHADFTSPDKWESQFQRVIDSFTEQFGQPPITSPERWESEFDRILDPVPPRLAEPPPRAQVTGAEVVEEQQHLRGLVAIKRRRLQALEIQEAKLGIHAPPHITIEIEDLRLEIADIESRL